MVTLLELQDFFLIQDAKKRLISVSVDIVDFYRTVTQLGIEVWIAGGWCVDTYEGDGHVLKIGVQAYSRGIAYEQSCLTILPGCTGFFMGTNILPS